MKIKLSETTPIQINWLVTTLECSIPAQFTSVPAMLNGTVRVFRGDTGQYSDPIEPATNWSHGGPISEREGISSQKENDGWWVACIYDINEEPKHYALSHSRLEAEMRCYVASKLGDEVEVPDELA